METSIDEDVRYGFVHSSKQGKARKGKTQLVAVTHYILEQSQSIA
jgi:hypothetical protein